MYSEFNPERKGWSRGACEAEAAGPWSPRKPGRGCQKLPGSCARTWTRERRGPPCCRHPAPEMATSLRTWSSRRREAKRARAPLPSRGNPVRG